ncbi:MAG: SLBB domain-containing protein [Myxococcota bacterium]
MAAWLAMVSAGGCAGLPTVPTTPSEDPAFSDPQPAVPPGMEDDDPVGLTVEPGDVLTVRAFTDEMVEHTGLVVDARGAVQLPLAGPVDVGGLPISEAEARVQKAMRKYDQVVRVHLVLEEPTGHRATVLGAVENAGRATLRPGMRVADLLAAVGGPIQDAESGEVVVLADLDASRLMRDGKALPVSLRLAVQGDPKHNVRVRPGDHLYVPASRGRHITVLGEVESPQLVAYRQDLRLTQALAVSGGLTSEGDRADIHVVRGSLRAPRVYQASLRAVVDGDARDVVLAPGDIVYVTQEWTANLGEVLNRLSPLLTVGATAGLTYILTQ